MPYSLCSILLITTPIRTPIYIHRIFGVKHFKPSLESLLTSTINSSGFATVACICLYFLSEWGVLIVSVINWV
jgi:hypothetical protein